MKILKKSLRKEDRSSNLKEILNHSGIEKVDTIRAKYETKALNHQLSLKYGFCVVLTHRPSKEAIKKSLLTVGTVLQACSNSELNIQMNNYKRF